MIVRSRCCNDSARQDVQDRRLARQLCRKADISSGDRDTMVLTDGCVSVRDGEIAAVGVQCRQPVRSIVRGCDCIKCNGGVSAAGER